MNQFESRSVGRKCNDGDGFGVTRVISTASVVLTPLAYIKVVTKVFLVPLKLSTDYSLWGKFTKKLTAR